MDTNHITTEDEGDLQPSRELYGKSVKPGDVGQVGGIDSQALGESGQRQRIDYLSVHLRQSHDYCQSIIEGVKTSCADWSTAGGLLLTPRIKALGPIGNKEHHYLLEWWGLAADCMAKLLPAHLLTQVSRVDYREEVEGIGDQSIEAFERFVSVNGKGNRNIHKFNSRGRNKMNGRNAGGIGVAVGSHKSDRRLSVYKRKGELGAIELQYSGAALDGVKAKAAGFMQTDKASWYEAICFVMQHETNLMAVSCGFDDYPAMCYYLSGDNQGVIAPLDGAEFERWQWVKWFDRQPYHEQVSILRELKLTPATLIALAFPA